MKNITLGLLILGMSLGSVNAQDGPPPEKKGGKAKKIAFLSTKLELTPAEAEKFWPVYNEAEAELKNLRKAHREARPKKKISEMTDAEVEKLIDEGLEFQQKELDIRKKYNTKFKEVLPIKKVAKLLHLEHEFRKKQQQNKKGGNKPPPPGGGQHPPR